MDQQPLVLLDVDGVICNFVAGVIKAHGWGITHANWNRYDWYKSKYMSDQDFWAPTTEAGWWLVLDPYPWAADLVKSIRGLGCRILYASSPALDSKCAAEKIEWLRKHKFMDGNEYMLGHAKYLMAGSGGVLVDDSEDQVNKFIRAGGDAILFPQPWNWFSIPFTSDKALVSDVVRQLERVLTDRGLI